MVSLNRANLPLCVSCAQEIQCCKLVRFRCCVFSLRVDAREPNPMHAVRALNTANITRGVNVNVTSTPFPCARHWPNGDWRFKRRTLCCSVVDGEFILSIINFPRARSRVSSGDHDLPGPHPGQVTVTSQGLMQDR